MVKHRTLLGLALVSCVSAACGGADGRSEPLSEVELTDSAGVRVVSFGKLEEVQAQLLTAKLIFRTDPDETVLSRIGDGAFLADGSLLLASEGNSELVLLDSKGAEIRRIGRPGEGPGEYIDPKWLQADSAGVWVYDQALRRLTRLGPELQFEHSQRLDNRDALSSVQPLTIARDTVLAVHGRFGHFGSSGEVRDTTPLLRILRSGSLDTLGLWPSTERAFATVPEGRLFVPIVFSRMAVAAGRGGHVVIGSTDAIDVRKFDLAGRLEWVLWGTAAPDPATPDEIQEYREVLLAKIPMDTPLAIEAWRTGPVRTSVPPLGALSMDDQGRVWVAGGKRPGQKRRLWVVFDSTGMPYGRVWLPTEFWGILRFNEVLDIRDGRVAVRLHTRLDEEYIEVWEVR